MTSEQQSQDRVFCPPHYTRLLLRDESWCKPYASWHPSSRPCTGPHGQFPQDLLLITKDSQSRLTTRISWRPLWFQMLLLIPDGCFVGGKLVPLSSWIWLARVRSLSSPSPESPKAPATEAWAARFRCDMVGAGVCSLAALQRRPGGALSQAKEPAKPEKSQPL